MMMQQIPLNMYAGSLAIILPWTSPMLWNRVVVVCVPRVISSDMVPPPLNAFPAFKKLLIISLKCDSAFERKNHMITSRKMFLSTHKTNDCSSNLPSRISWYRFHAICMRASIQKSCRAAFAR